MSLDHDPLFDRRRRRVVAALAAGLMGAGVSSCSRIGLRPKVPGPLPAGQSFYDLVGAVNVDGAAATMATRVHPHSTIITGHDSRAIFVVGRDAFLLRTNSRLTLTADGDDAAVLTLQAGALLTVFGKREHMIRLPIASVGIRGTGVYAEAEPDRAYICTCYGTTEIMAGQGKGAREIVTATHHTARYVLTDGRQRIIPAPKKNHMDHELILIDALVGRVPPFVGQVELDEPY